MMTVEEILEYLNSSRIEDMTEEMHECSTRQSQAAIRKTMELNTKTLRQLHKKSGLSLKKFFNTSGQLYRDMELSKKLKDMSEDEMFKLLSSDGMLVKRPLLITGNKVLTGFKEEDWKNAL